LLSQRFKTVDITTSNINKEGEVCDYNYNQKQSKALTEKKTIKKTANKKGKRNPEVSKRTDAVL